VPGAKASRSQNVMDFGRVKSLLELKWFNVGTVTYIGEAMQMAVMTRDEHEQRPDDGLDQELRELLRRIENEPISDELRRLVHSLEAALKNADKGQLHD